MTVLHLGSFENSLFELKKRVSTVTPSQEDEFLHGYEIFFQDSCPFPYIKTLTKVSDLFLKNIRHESTPLKADRQKLERREWMLSFLHTS